MTTISFPEVLTPDTLLRDSSLEASTAKILVISFTSCLNSEGGVVLCLKRDSLWSRTGWETSWIIACVGDGR